MSQNPPAGSPAQTLSRGLRALVIIPARPEPPTIAELADELGVHRSIAYRILRTLEDHALVRRDNTGRLEGAPGLASLARGVQRDLQSAALPELTALANELGMTAFLAVWDPEACITLVSVAPRHSTAPVMQRPGSRHPLTHGAPGIAIQSAYSRTGWEEVAPKHPWRAAAEQARTDGYATSLDEVIPGVSSIAAALQVPGQTPAAVAVVYATAAHDVHADALGRRVAAAAASVEVALGA
ncbi:MAG: helix-turn-helix domain-containing protein [Micrococcaceae bacterium]|nr:helix-turn-helix domain-containing protein [Micrococcaceae bacterium]